MAEKVNGFVYIATIPTYQQMGIYKIGMTTDLIKRIGSLNTSNIEDFFYVACVACDCVVMEELVHKEMQHLRVKREFYKLTQKYISYVLEFCENVNYICYD